jgi:hypothetical protein
VATAGASNHERLPTSLHVGVGLFYQFKELKLDGGALILVGVLIANYVNLLQFKLGQASARIDELEKRLAVR